MRFMPSSSAGEQSGEHRGFFEPGYGMIGAPILGQFDMANCETNYALLSLCDHKTKHVFLRKLGIH